MSTGEWKRLHDEYEAESRSERQASIPNTLEELEEMFLEGLHSGPGIVMNDAEWSRLREEIEADAHAERRAS